jgi:hypothetical protein
MRNGKITTAAVVLLFGLFLFAREARAQTIDGYTSIEYYADTNTVDAYSETDEDYDVQSAYGAYVSLSVRDQNNNLMGWDTASDDGTYGYAAVEVQFSGTPDTTYFAWGLHKTNAEQYDYNYDYNQEYGTIYYFDYYYFSSFESQGIIEPYYYAFLGRGPTVTRPSPQIILGGTDDEAYVTTPSSPEVLLTNAKLYELTAPFTGVGSALQTAIFQAGSSAHANDICGDDPQEFLVTVNFQLPSDGVLVPARCKAIPQGLPRPNYNIAKVTCMMDQGVVGHLSFHARRRCCHESDHDPGIRFVIGANKTGQTGTIDTPGSVRVLCSQ